MSIGLGIGVQRPKQLRSIYSVDGKVPGFTADFIKNKYPSYPSFASAITHARSTNAVMTDGYGPELVTNGGFDSDSDWDKGTGWSISDGNAHRSNTGSTSGLAQTITLTADVVYEVSYHLQIDSGNVRTQFIGGTNTSATEHTTSGYKRDYIKANTGNTQVRLWASTTFAGTIDNVSVREMPVLKWGPHNLLSYSEDFSNAYWTKRSGVSVTQNSGTAPDGTNTASTLNEGSTASAYHGFYKLSVFDGPSDVVFSVFAKNIDGQYINLASASSSSNYAGAVYDLSSGSVASSASNGAYSNHSASIVDCGNGWYKCVLSFSVASGNAISPDIEMTNSTTISSYGVPATYNGSNREILVWGAHVYRSDLGGMVDNPDQPASRASYVPTAAVASGDSIVVDGGFDDPTNWTLGTGWSISGSKLVGSNVGGTAYAQQTLNTTSGAYVVTFDVTDYTSGNLDVFLGGSTSAVVSITGAGSYSVVITGVGTYTATTLRLSAGNANFTGSVDNLVVRKSLVDPSAARHLPRIGHHVYNGSAWVNEGLFAESESRVNIITGNDDLDNSTHWFAANISVSKDAGVVAPDGNSAWKLTNGTGQNFNLLSTVASIAPTDNNYITLSCYLKKGNTRYAVLGFGGSKYSACVFDFDTETVTDTDFDQVGSPTLTTTVQSVGNGWYRVGLTHLQDGSVNPGRGMTIYPWTSATVPTPLDLHGVTGAGETLYVAFPQAEYYATPSSPIPTTTGQVTRAAETFTIPSANLPWPPEVLSGVEEITSGTFDTAAALDDFSTSGTVTYDTATQSARLQSSSQLTQFLDGTDDVSGSYKITWNQTLVSGTRTRLLVRNYANTSYLSTAYFNGSGEKSVVVTTTDGVMFRINSDNSEALIDNISVQKVEDIAVSIAMDGRISHRGVVDTFFRWREDGNNYINNVFWTDYRFITAQKDGTTYDQVASAVNLFSGDLLEPYNTASRHGSTFINGAVDGVALTADTTPTLLTDLSDTDLELAFGYMGTIGTFRVWDKDLGDTGLVEATNPSLEPSLSLTFEGTGTNSFVVNNWSE